MQQQLSLKVAFPKTQDHKQDSQQETLPMAQVIKTMHSWYADLT